MDFWGADPCAIIWFGEQPRALAHPPCADFQGFAADSRPSPWSAGGSPSPDHIGLFLNLSVCEYTLSASSMLGVHRPSRPVLPVYNFEFIRAFVFFSQPPPSATQRSLLCSGSNANITRLFFHRAPISMCSRFQHTTCFVDGTKSQWAFLPRVLTAPKSSCLMRIRATASIFPE